MIELYGLNMEAIINKKAKFDYFLEENYECGIILEGWELKPILKRKVNLDMSHVIIKDGEVFLLNCNITPEKTSDLFSKIEPTRTRKLLLNKKEITHLIGKVEQKGYTLIPTKIYKKGSKFKVEVCLGKGKKNHDKREAVKQRDWEREQSSIMKKRNTI